MPVVRVELERPDPIEEDDVADVELDLADARAVEEHRVHDVLLGDLGPAEREPEGKDEMVPVRKLQGKITMVLSLSWLPFECIVSTPNIYLINEGLVLRFIK